jgi:hypothetical protein
MSTKKSKSNEKPSPELQALYKEYWATKTKFGQQIMDAMDRFGVYSDQVERIQLREAKEINAIYEKIKKQEEVDKEKVAAAKSSGSKKKKKSVKKGSKRSKKRRSRRR